MFIYFSSTSSYEIDQNSSDESDSEVIKVILKFKLKKEIHIKCFYYNNYYLFQTDWENAEADEAEVRKFSFIFLLIFYFLSFFLIILRINGLHLFI